MDERGTALAAALCIIIVLLPLGALVALQCRTDLAIRHNLRTEIEAFYVAEAGLEHAVAEIGPGQSFAALLVGPDGVPGTADDGVFPFREGVPAPFPRAPYRYEVHVEDAQGAMVRLISQGMGEHGASKIVEGVVGRSAFPVTPAALYAERDLSGFDMGTGGFSISGFDHQPQDGSASSDPGSAVAALSSPSGDTEASLRQHFWLNDADRLTGAGGTPSISTTTALGVERYAAAVTQQGQAVILTGLHGTPPVLGAPSAPQLTVVAGPLDIADSLTGSGVLVVQGMLHVAGSFNFTGLVVAMGGVVSDPASTVAVAGALWCGPSQDERLEFRGHGAVAYSRSALSAVDRAWPALLPHAAMLVAWQESL